jgi:hypothetical protein
MTGVTPLDRVQTKTVGQQLNHARPRGELLRGIQIFEVGKGIFIIHRISHYSCYKSLGFVQNIDSHTSMMAA